MKNSYLSFLIAGLLIPALGSIAQPAQAQLYKSVGPDGKVTYSDTPPASNQKAVEKRDIGEQISTVSLPYELAQAVRNNPVTIYTTSNCGPCQDGKSLLKTAGIPFAEKTVKTNPDMEKLQQVSGDTQLPVLIVGSQKLRGYNQAEWNAAIQKAGYPSSNMLPAAYRYPSPESAAPPVASKEKEAPAPKETAKPAQPASKPASDNGFRF